MDDFGFWIMSFWEENEWSWRNTDKTNRSAMEEIEEEIRQRLMLAERRILRRMHAMRRAEYQQQMRHLITGVDLEDSWGLIEFAKVIIVNTPELAKQAEERSKEDILKRRMEEEKKKTEPVKKKEAEKKAEEEKIFKIKTKF